MGHQRQPEQEPEHDPGESSGSVPGREPAGTGGSLVGQTLEGRYRFDALLGEGTFARVYRVHDLVRRVDLAAKVLRSDIAQEPAFLERFRREAGVLARLQHPNIVRYYDIVESGRQVFILTDYIAGDTLQWRLRELPGGTLTPFDSLRLLRPLMAALNYAHREGVVHRDLKPANILIDPSEHVYVMDFGIAKILTDTSTLTVDMTVGTPHYMSPEQILAAEVTTATDVYALGIILYQMYTGQLPFVGETDVPGGNTTAVRIAYEHLHVAPTPPTQVNRRLSMAVEDVILKCLAKDPGQRYQTVSDLYDALAEAVGTPSMALTEPDAAQFTAQLSGVPVAERVPTAAGGLSQIGTALERETPPDEVDSGTAGELGAFEKPKRKAKRQSQWQAQREEMKRQKQKEKGDEKEGEKQTEKQKEYDEKEREKGPEKAQLWTFGGSGDRLSQLSWGLMVVWAGVIFLAGFANWGAWMMAGAGSLMLLEAGVRLMVPEFRANPGARLIMGSVLLSVGLGMALSLESLWPIVLIAIGVSILINHLVE